jgi:16S rRNA (cytidine1402-2'-O)-methyltransferase
MPTLYIVSTPIGNLEDITLRALRVLGEVPLIVAEDTRKTGLLLKHYHIETRMLSLHKDTSPARVRHILEQLERRDVALVSEAGTPALSDPGEDLITAAIERGHKVVPIPGPTAVTAALVVSGLPVGEFTFVGFLPRTARERRRYLSELADDTRTIVLFEAPHRLAATLRDMAAILGQRRMAVARELTKMHEQIWRGDTTQAVAHWTEHTPRGEITLIVEGHTQEPSRWSEPEVVRELHRRLEGGSRPRSAARSIAAQSGWSSRDIYRLYLRSKSGPPAPTADTARPGMDGGRDADSRLAR